jgi:hypothetical protein
MISHIVDQRQRSRDVDRYDRSMNAHARTLALAAIALSSGVAMAQVRKGAPPPEFTFIQCWNGAPKSFADLAGKVVILDFANSK